MRLTLVFLMAFVLFTGCNSNDIEGSNIFIGKYKIMDQLVPYPYLIQQKNDSIYLFNNLGVLVDKTKNEGIKSNSDLKFKKSRFKIYKKNKTGFIASDLLDTINFKLYKNGEPNRKDAAEFEKLSLVKGLNLEKLKEDLKSSIWKYDLVADENTNPNKDLDIELLMAFKNDSLNIITNYYYQGLKTVSENETKAYHIFELGGVSFLSFQKEADNPQPIYQIIKHDDTTIELKDFSSREIKNISFHKSSMGQETFMELFHNTPSYANCFDGYQGEYYFGEDVTYNKGNKYILDLVNEEAPTNDVNSGYVIVHFNINCHGSVGRFGLIQMDRAFKETAFSNELVSHILNKVSQLKDFPSSYSQLDYLNYKDVHAFLMFKIETGKITDLCP